MGLMSSLQQYATVWVAWGLDVFGWAILAWLVFFAVTVVVAWYFSEDGNE